MTHDIRLQAQTLEEETRRMILRCISTAYSSHGIYMVYSWLMCGHQGRIIYCQHGPCIYCINRVAIHQGLLVKFSCDSHLIYIYCLYCYWSFDQWLLQKSAGYALRCCFEVSPFSFINFASKALLNSLKLSFQHVITLFLLSISHLHSHIPSSKLRIVCHILIFYDFVLLQLCILLSHL